MRDCSAATITDSGGTRDFRFTRSEFGTLFGLGGRGFSLGARGFLGAQDRHACRFGALGFRGSGLSLLHRLGRCLSGGGFRCGMFLGGGLHVGSFAAPADRRLATDCLGNRDWFGRYGRGGGATTARGRRRSSLLFGAGALLSLPASADASDLVVGEHAHVASDRNVHMPKKGDHLFGWNSEFVCQLTD